MSDFNTAEWPPWLAEDYQRDLNRPNYSENPRSPEELRRVYDDIARVVTAVGYDPTTMKLKSAVVVVGDPSPGRYEGTFNIAVNISYLSPLITPLDIADYVDRWVNYDMRLCVTSRRAFIFQQRGQQMPQVWRDVDPVTEGYNRDDYNGWFHEVVRDFEAALSIRIALTNIITSNDYNAAIYVEDGNNYQSFSFVLRDIPQQHVGVLKDLFGFALYRMTDEEEERLGYTQLKNEAETMLSNLNLHVHIFSDGSSAGVLIMP